MKSAADRFLRIVALATLAFCTFTANRTTAQVTNTFTFSATAQIQSAAHDNGTSATTPRPDSFKVDTKQLLAFLAVDEFASGNYGATNFPSGARLVAIDIPVFEANNFVFQVVDRDGNGILNVSDVLSLTSGTNVVFWGRAGDRTNIFLSSFTRLYTQTLRYDASTNGGTGLHFFIQGSVVSKTTDSTPTRGGSFEQATTAHLTGEGDGRFNGLALAVNGDLEVTSRRSLLVNFNGGPGDGGSGGVIITRPIWSTNPPTVIIPPPPIIRTNPVIIIPPPRLPISTN